MLTVTPGHQDAHGGQRQRQGVGHCDEYRGIDPQDQSGHGEVRELPRHELHRVATSDAWSTGLAVVPLGYDPKSDPPFPPARPARTAFGDCQVDPGGQHGSRKRREVNGWWRAGKHAPRHPQPKHGSCGTEECHPGADDEQVEGAGPPARRRTGGSRRGSPGPLALLGRRTVTDSAAIATAPTPVGAPQDRAPLRRAPDDKWEARANNTPANAKTRSMAAEDHSVYAVGRPVPKVCW